jgi:hypothetical protein
MARINGWRSLAPRIMTLTAMTLAVVVSIKTLARAEDEGPFIRTKTVAPAKEIAPANAVTPEGIIGMRLTDVTGHAQCIGRIPGSTAVALVVLGAECPISNKAVPELNRLSKLAADKKVEFYGILSDPTVTRSTARHFASEYNTQFPVLFDASGDLAAKLKPAVTPHAFVLAADGRILYSGRIDDSYVAVGKSRPDATTHDLQGAITSAAAGKTTDNTTPVGCIFEAWKTHPLASTVTYTRDIAPILNTSCIDCHHAGEVAPFSLTNYHDAAKRAEMLAMVTESHQMPPWKGTPGCGTFIDERRLTADQIHLIDAWAKAGAPEGNAADLPPQPVFKDGWMLGQPDMVVKMPKAFDVPAAGRDIVRYFVVPMNVDKDMYVTAFEYRPGSRKVVHHMIAFLDTRGQARKIAQERGDGYSYASFGGPGFLPTGGLGGWAPGMTPRPLPDGVVKLLRKGSDLVMQIHYHPNGKAESDQGEIAFYFSKKPVEHITFSYMLNNRQINIPAGEKHYVRTASVTTPVDVTLVGLTPHMHNVGREMKVTATFPDGTTQPLCWVKDWDWNWQNQYQYVSPIKLPRGTRVDMEAVYDNSTDNPHNPNTPPKAIHLGEQTTDEMCLCFLQVYVDSLGGRAALRTAAQQHDSGN